MQSTCIGTQSATRRRLTVSRARGIRQQFGKEWAATTGPFPSSSVSRQVFTRESSEAGGLPTRKVHFGPTTPKHRARDWARPSIRPTRASGTTAFTCRAGCKECDVSKKPSRRPGQVPRFVMPHPRRRHWMMSAAVNLDSTLPATSRNSHCNGSRDFPAVQPSMMLKAKNKFQSRIAFSNALNRS